MDTKIKDLAGLKEVVNQRWRQLDDVRDYLNDAGLARKEAFQCIYFHASFCDTLEELNNLEGFQNLVNIPYKHPEYYKTVRMINRFVQKIVSKD